MNFEQRHAGLGVKPDTLKSWVTLVCSLRSVCVESVGSNGPVDVMV